MTAYEKAYGIIARICVDIWGKKGISLETAEGFATHILRELNGAQLVVVVSKGSADMLKRYHAHLRYLGQETGYGYAQIKADAEKYAISFGEWPTKSWTTEIEAAGEKFTVDIDIPLSSTLATNAQLMRAYEYITQTAEEHGIKLPESVLYEESV